MRTKLNGCLLLRKNVSRLLFLLFAPNILVWRLLRFCVYRKLKIEIDCGEKMPIMLIVDCKFLSVVIMMRTNIREKE